MRAPAWLRCAPRWLSYTMYSLALGAPYVNQYTRKGDCPDRRRKLATLDLHRLRGSGSFRNRLLGNSGGHRRQQQRNLAMADDFAELALGHQQSRADPTFDVIAVAPAPDVSANGFDDGKGRLNHVGAV